MCQQILKKTKQWDGIDLMEWLLCISGEVKAGRYFQHDRYAGKLNGSYWLDHGRIQRGGATGGPEKSQKYKVS